MPFRRSRQILAAMVVVALIAVSAGFPASAASTATLLGRVHGADGATPRSNIIISLVDESGETVYDSAPTNDEGMFRVDGAPAGSYTVFARAPEGTFLAGRQVALKSGVNPPVTLALLPADPPPDKEDKGDTGETGDKDEGGGESAGEETGGEESQPPPPPVTDQDEGWPVWAKGTLIGVISLAGIGAIYWLGKDEDIGSPF